jgi:hypothetical protein
MPSSGATMGRRDEAMMDLHRWKLIECCVCSASHRRSAPLDDFAGGHGRAGGKYRGALRPPLLVVCPPGGRGRTDCLSQ